MPVEGNATFYPSYQMAKKGINLHISAVEVTPLECIQSKNLYWRDGIIKRRGFNKVSNDEVSAGDKITGLHRFYKQDGSSDLLVSSGSVIVKQDGSTWSDIKTGLNSDLDTLMETWGALDAVYIGNGVDSGMKWDGSVISTIAGTAPPVKPIQFLSYQDRLLFIDSEKPGELRWSASFDDTVWQTAGQTGVRPDSQLFGLIIHSATVSDQGVQAKVLLAGANGMYIFSGSDLTDSSTADFTINTVANKIGCNAPRTMTWTPMGTIYLGIDKQVYLLPFDSLFPVAIGDKISSENSSTNGIEDIPANAISKSSAVYHDGFYKLSFAGAGSSTNNKQFWLDVKRLELDENKHAGPWFGPMEGMEFGPMITLDGPNDSSQWYAGDSVGGSGRSLIYEGSFRDIFSDNLSDIDCTLQTFFSPLTEVALPKDVHFLESELLDENGSVIFDLHDITGAKRSGITLNTGGANNLYGTFLYGVELYSGPKIQRDRMGVDPAIHVRLLSVVVKSNGTKRFELYSLRVEAQELNLGMEI